GEQVCFDGSGFIPPDGWDAPDEPALDPTYEAGYFWAYQDNTPGGGSISCCTIAPTKGGAEDRESICNPPGYFTLSKIECPGEGSGLCAGDIDRGCDPAMEDILATHWPSDGCVNLAVKGGTIVGSKYDPDQDGSYSKPMSEINLCDGAGNQIKLAPSADGGWKTIDAINGGDGYLYDSQGQQIARISGDEFSDPTI
ncbi:MAG: hypothetical protein R3215_15630, partial [Halomonas sp.]|nr:hypothetical protein [Halomonas sp.]